MILGKKAFAGTLESSDVFVEVAPGQAGLEVDVQSPVADQFGSAIRRAALEVARQFGVEAATITLNDRGALECTIRARVETALKRAAGA